MSKQAPNDIAIIGMSGRFPGAKDISQFWKNLREGVESISFFTPQELISSGVDPSVLNNPNYVRASGVLEHIDLFDASFFGYNPREAESIDPQQRLFLECAWHALEDAAYDPDRYSGIIGVYAGTSMSTYAFQLYGNPDFVGLVGYFPILIGNDKDYLATRVSYKLNLKGPSISIQTACSTSLVAVCQACQSLLDHQCDIALAGGITVRVPHKTGYFYQKEGIYSPDGYCRAFDAKAQGTVFGNGLGIVVLKRLEEALADGDHIYAVIKGSAVNNDGSLKVGYTAPSMEGQAEVIAMAQSFAGVKPETITYVETHGTGTALGDPIEVEALTQAFRAGTGKKNFCAIGSVKTNIGHLDSAAGIASLIKTVFSLKHKKLPPSLHFEHPNPGIDFTNSPFYVNTKLSHWKSGRHPRRAGVSAFGIGGTNAHVVLEEAPVIEESGSSRPAQLVILSAKTKSALAAAAANLAEHLREHPDLNLADVAYTSQVGRKAFNHRRLIISHSLEEAVNALETGDTRRVFSATPTAREKPVVFMFSGQGSQYADMGGNLYQIEPAFREQVDRCSEALEPRLGFDLREVLFPCPERAEDAALQLKQTAVTQPALFVVEYALAQLLLEWGVHPQAMIGHSIGEYVAACLAGVFSLEDALFLIAERGRLMQELPGGSMLVVPLPGRDVLSYMDGQLSLAAVNEPSMCVVSGPTNEIERLEANLVRDGIVTRRLHTSHAFHSAMMDPILAPFADIVRSIPLRPPQIPFISNATGAWITNADATSPVYWANHIRQCVRFADGLQTLYKDLDSVLLEIGPGQSLSTFARRHPKRPSERIVLSSMRHPHDRQPDFDFLLNTVGQLWLAGVDIDWSGFHARERRQRVSLPGYPYQRQRYWVEPGKPAMAAAPAVSNGKNPDPADWFYVPSWKRVPAPERRADPSKTRWLIFEDPYDIGAHMARRLEQEGQDVIRVRVGEQGFARKSEKIFEVNPGEAGQYHALLKQLRHLDLLPDRIVHFWSITLDKQPLYELAQKMGFYSLLFLAQALGEQAPDQIVQIGVITDHTQSVTGEEKLLPQKATFFGPCKVIPQEYPNITCRCIDLSLSIPLNGTPEKMIGSLITELRMNRPEVITAYRGNQPWLQTFDRMRLEKPAEEALPLRHGGVYLITGGLGGIGLVMARYLAQTVQARLVLVGRSAFPERNHWEGWLSSHNASDDVSADIVYKIRAVQEIEQLGGQILVLSADVADQEQMQQALHIVNKKFGPVHGVIHAAGIAGGGIIQLKTPEVVERVLEPKVQGALVLNNLFKEEPLDFFVLFSSLTSILGGAGQVDYCGANAFLDAFAHHFEPKGWKRLVSVNWDTWQEVGMAVKTDVPHSLKAWRQETLKLGILPIEGTDAFARFLHISAPQIAVTPRDIGELLNSHHPQPTLPALDKQQETAASTAQHPRPELDSPYVAPRNPLEQELAAIWQEILGVGRLGVHDNFFTDLNGHSLLATQLMSRLRSKYHLEIPLQRFFEVPTIAGLASAIEAIGAASNHELDEPQLVPVRRDNRRGIVSADGVLQISNELDKD